MVERGPWIPRGPHCWAPDGTITRTLWYESDGYAPARTDKGLQEVRSVAAVGGLELSATRALGWRVP
jgi:hypothetical protein